MAAPTNYCFSSVQLCRLRACLLDETGKPDPGETSLIVTDVLIDLGYKLVLKEGAKVEQENGCGDLCLSFQDRDKIQSVDLTMTLCKLDAALIELLTGSHLVIVNDVIRGFTVTDADEEIDREVSIEGWSLAYDFDEPAVVDGDVWRNRFIFPRTTWTLGDGKLANEPFAVPLTGRGKSNSQFGDGPANDLPWDEYTRPMGVWFDDDPLPDAYCGYQTLVAS